MAMRRLAGATALLLAVALAPTAWPPPAVAQQLPAGRLQLPGPGRAAAGTATAAAEEGQLSRFVQPGPLAGPAAEPGAAASGRRSVQAAAAAGEGGEPPQLPADGLLLAQHLLHGASSATRLDQPSLAHAAAAQRRVRPASRRLDEQQQQVAGPLALPGPGQRFSGAGQMVNQQIAARASPTAEHSAAPNDVAAAPQGRNVRRLQVAAPLPEVALLPEAEAVVAAAMAAPAAEQPEQAAALVAPGAEQPGEAAAAPPIPAPPPPPSAKQLPSPFAPIEVPTTAMEAAPPAEEVAAPQVQPPAAGAEAAPEEQPSFEPLFPGVPPGQLAAAPEAEPLPESATTGAPAATEVPGLGSEADILAQAELALSGGGGNATAPAFPVAGAEAGAGAALPVPPQAGQPGSNFSSLVSLLAPPAGFQMPPLTAQQQENLPKLRQLRLGTGTVSVQRNVGNFGGTAMACGMGYLSDYFKDHFVALPTTLYRSGELCGACVRLWCVDSICQDALVRNASFMVTDSCKECSGNSILVSERGFANLTGVNINISPMLQVAWTFESCAPLIRGGIKMLASKNNGPTFLSYNFSNLKQLLRGVTIGGTPFARTAYGAWELNSPGRDIAIPKTGAEIVLTSVDGQRISRRLRSLGSQDLGINFA